MPAGPGRRGPGREDKKWKRATGERNPCIGPIPYITLLVLLTAGFLYAQSNEERRQKTSDP